MYTSDWWCSDHTSGAILRFTFNEMFWHFRTDCRTLLRMDFHFTTITSKCFVSVFVVVFTNSCKSRGKVPISPSCMSQLISIQHQHVSKVICILLKAPHCRAARMTVAVSSCNSMVAVAFTFRISTHVFVMCACLLLLYFCIFICFSPLSFPICTVLTHFSTVSIIYLVFI